MPGSMPSRKWWKKSESKQIELRRLSCSKLFSSHEVWVVLQGSIIRALSLSYYSVYVPLVMFAMFSVYATGGGTITPKRVFTILSLLSVVRAFAVHFFTNGVLMVSEALVAVTRIQVLYDGLIACFHNYNLHLDFSTHEGLHVNSLDN